MTQITKTTVTPYLMLNGKAKEVMKFYQQAIGGEWQVRSSHRSLRLSLDVR